MMVTAAESNTHSVLEQALDDGRVHELLLVHLSDFRRDLILSKTTDYDTLVSQAILHLGVG